MTSSLLVAFALMLVIEGLLPFIAPRVWRETFRRVTELTDGQIRFIGLTSILIGLLVMAEGIEDLLPDEAVAVESLRRRLLDEFARHGYQLVAPPLLEYVESLFTGSGHDLDPRTFKLIDQLSGRTMGVRADITPQVARIDAHLLNRRGVTRLCYCGSVLHTLPAGLLASREPMQIGVAGARGNLRRARRPRPRRHLPRADGRGGACG